jgi:non-ribosomal peptide synthetase component E (peptide arylation enzyme)
VSSSPETWPQGTTLSALIDDSVRSMPDKLALVNAAASFTFRELNDLIVKAP